jgi:hypothetical protein
MVLVPSALTSICVVLPVTYGSEMTAIGAEQLATYITDLQTKLSIKQTEQGRIDLVGCETDKPTSSGEVSSLAQLVAQRLYDGLQLMYLTIASFHPQGLNGHQNHPTDSLTLRCGF